MKRKAEKDIEKWFLQENRKHLYVTGMRGTGKTTLIRQYFETNVPNRFLYINYETDCEIRSFFTDRIKTSAANINDLINAYYNTELGQIGPEYVILDEIHVLSGLKDTSIQEKLFHIAAQTDRTRLIFIDSENPVEISFFKENPHYDAIFEKIRLFPLTFDEFLLNTGKEWYHDVIAGHFERMRPIPELVGNEINDIFSDYLITGGMPAVIFGYINKNYSLENLNIEELQQRELRNILGAMGEYCVQDLPKISALLEASVSQRIENCRHFVFGRLVRGTSYSYYASAIEKLCNAGILIKAHFNDHFRFFWSDTGLLAMKIKSGYPCDQNKYNEIIAENYLAQQLYNKNPEPEYWCSDNASRIDQILSSDGLKIPVKYIGSSGRKIRSLQIYEKELGRSEKNIKEMIAVTDSDFYIMGNLKAIPLYAVFCLIQ